MKFFTKIIILLLLNSVVTAQSSHKLRLEADKSYMDGEHNTAEINYKKALEKENEYKANYNLGNALYNQDRFEEASEAFQKALSVTNDKSIKSKLYHNLGNSYFGQKDLNKSIESFKESLRLNSKEESTRKNLNLAKQMLKQQKRQQKQDKQDNKKEQKKEEQKEQEKQQNKKENKEEEKEQQNQEQQENKDREEEKNPQNEENKEKMTKEEMMKLLRAIEDDDKKIQKMVRKTSERSEKREKDW